MCASWSWQAEFPGFSSTGARSVNDWERLQPGRAPSGRSRSAFRRSGLYGQRTSVNGRRGPLTAASASRASGPVGPVGPLPKVIARPRPQTVKAGAHRLVPPPAAACGGVVPRPPVREAENPSRLGPVHVEQVPRDGLRQHGLQDGEFAGRFDGMEILRRAHMKETSARPSFPICTNPPLAVLGGWTSPVHRVYYPRETPIWTSSARCKRFTRSEGHRHAD
jgi:hypothetical protein